MGKRVSGRVTVKTLDGKTIRTYTPGRRKPPKLPTPEQAVAKNADWTTPEQQALFLGVYRRQVPPP